MTAIKPDNALVSVSDKTGLVGFVRALADASVRIYSTGGTRHTLSEAGVPVLDVAEYTGFPEMLDGRVKTLHPKVHGGILARRDLPEHVRALEAHAIRPFDMVVVNLYPFEQTVARPGCTLEEAIEQIDIGGPSMIRSAAKNHAWVAVVTDPAQYAAVLDALRAGGIGAALRRQLALDAFRLTARYDRMIARYLESSSGGAEAFPSELTLDLARKQVLRYGENPHQQAAFYADRGTSGPSVATARQLHGKELSFNNILDLDSARELVAEFREPAAAVIKHTNPCGAAAAATLDQAFLRAHAGDPLSAFGCVLGLNQRVDERAATAIAKTARFVEAIIAPSYCDEAVRTLTTRPTWKTNVRLVETGNEAGDRPGESAGLDYRRMSGGFLVQTRDRGPDPEQDWKVVTRRQPTPEQLDDLRFACKVVKHVKSNAIVLAKNCSVVGVGAGQMNRVEAVALATRQAGDRARGSVLAGDAFFPFRDGPDLAIAAGVTAMIQPGGSRRDDETIAACDEHNIAMIFTGRRHFRH